MKSVVFQSAAEASPGLEIRRVDGNNHVRFPISEPGLGYFSASGSPIHFALPMETGGIVVRAHDPWPLGDSVCKVNAMSFRMREEYQKSKTGLAAAFNSSLSAAEKTLADLRSKFAGDAPPEMPLADIITAIIAGFQSAHDDIVVERDQLREDNAMLRQHVSPEYK